ncbi:S8 family serine peptidase [Streptomyces roseirectus]|uniref:S8 family serine peptidase n=1 Tax=Streptomyces roseirectus TaxID=2768066 RepID=A0A7H0I881_9ACTN|nr:S8 family serine peptidase [Streptomyces roseirectus]QNP68997.1 S8 family serine peptidase [Streptomyces roseirectus]
MGSTARARTAALAALVAGVLVTGEATAGGEPARAAGVGARPATTVTLITGDRVAVGEDGRVASLVRGEGREKVGFSVRRAGGHTHVIPQDALRLIADGVLDRRLFDVTRLAADGYGDALPLIVSYRGPAMKTAARDPFAGLAVRERRALPAVDGEAFAVSGAATPALWKAVTGRASARTADGASAPVRPITRVWLDAKVRASLAESVPRIGAPALWKSGQTGKGVTVAVLDSGVDETHPDLKGVEVTQKNFSGAPDVKDRYGHGTHVASILAGSGARSGGRYKGVAPGVRLLDGKVLADDGFGDTSGIVAGMQWAVDQGARVVNMSLGSLDSPGTDPMEAAVARLSGKALFVVSAGNDGAKPGTIGTPGSAPAALTVGSVDKQDRIADDSSRGPNLDGTPKPDITGPGVDITAAQTTQGSEPAGDGYAVHSGTSMAAPHVAGAAALLLQRRPELSGARLKSLLTGSAEPNPRLSAHEQGAGRVDVARAAGAQVVAEPGSLGFGMQAWPHSDDKPLSRTLTYRNLGTRPVTLRLSTSGTAPAGMFTVKDAQLTVPAGGTATTSVVADTRKGTLDGVFGGTVLAAGDGQQVRTGLVVEREVESYDVTVRHIDADGANPAAYTTTITSRGEGGGYVELPYRADGTVVQRLRKGSYHLDSLVFAADNTPGFFVQPVLEVNRTLTVTLDSRKAKPFTVKAPDPAAKPVTSNVGYFDPSSGVGNSWSSGGAPPVRTLALGPVSPRLKAQFNGVWKAPGAAGQNVDHRFAFHRTGSFFTGLNRTVTRAEVAEVKLGFGASAAGVRGRVHITPLDPDGDTAGIAEPQEQKLPRSTTHYLSADGVRWSWTAAQVDARGEARVEYTKERVTYKAGSSQVLRFNTGVVGPDLAAKGPQGADRTGDLISARISLFNDGSGNPGTSVVAKGFARLESGGRVLGEGPATEWLSTEVPAASAAYRLTVEGSRAAVDTATSTKVSGVWTFTSARPASGATARLPLSTVRLAPQLSLRGTAPAGGTLTVPLRIGGPAAGAGQVAALAVHVSYDAGRTWKPLTVTTDTKGARSVTVKHPATAKAATFRVDLKDKAGNTVRETITNAYLLAP